MLADYLRHNPDEVYGDNDLPDHLDAALDALEGLPVAALEWKSPDYYDAGVDDFLQDSERVFLNVTRRLQRLREAVDQSRPT